MKTGGTTMEQSFIDLLASDFKRQYAESLKCKASDADIYDSKELIKKAIKNISKKKYSKAMACMSYLEKQINVPSDIRLSEIVLSANVITSIANGNTCSVESSAKQIPWLSDRIQKYRDICDRSTPENRKDTSQKYKYITNKAHSQFDNERYQVAKLNYETALKFCQNNSEYRTCFEYMSDSNKTNRKIIEWFYLFDGYQDDYDYLAEKWCDSENDIAVIAYEKNVEAVTYNSKLLSFTDKYGMNLFLYSILYDSPSITALYSDAQIKELIKSRNILGHDYKCLAALQGFQRKDGYFNKILSQYDESFKYEQMRQQKPPANNETMKELKNIGIGILHFVADVLNENAKMNKPNYDSSLMDEIVNGLGSKKDSYNTDNRPVDRLINYVSKSFNDSIKAISKTYLQERSREAEELFMIYKRGNYIAR